MATTFKVAPVKPNDLKFKESSVTKVSDVIAEYFKEVYPEEESLKFEVGFSNHNLIIPKGRGPSHLNGLIATVLAAYNNHWPLILSPDDFWLMIALAVGQFLGSDPEMAEKYRYSFVSHEGKKNLIVMADKYGIKPKDPKANGVGWPGAMQEMVEKIKDETATNIGDIMTKPFSTTGNIEQTAMNTTLMETMKNYFEYTCMLFCGIPEITLEGTEEDYQSILDRLDELMTIFPDFVWYLKRVHAILIKVLDSKKGKVDQDWWRTMIVDRSEGSGSTAFKGWLAEFIAYIPHYMDKSKLRPYDRESWDYMNLDDANTTAVTFTDFKLDDQQFTMKIYDMKLVSGFLGVALDENKKAVRPAIGWMTYYWKERSQ